MGKEEESVEREIAQRQRAEAALREAERRYDELVKSSEDLIWTHDPAGRVLSANPAMVRLIGCERKEIVGHPLDSLLSPAGVQKFPAYLETLARDGHAEGFLRILTRAGEERVLQYESTARIIERGESIVFGVAHDVQRRWAERALRLSVSRLEAVPRGRPPGASGIAPDISERHRLEEQLVQSQKMEAMGRLAGGIAHDFNNLLTTILGYCDLVLSQIPGESPVRADVAEIERAGLRAVELTRQLLAFSRKQVVETRVLDLNAVVAEASRMLRRLIGENIDLVAQLDPELGRVRADPGQVEQVLVNLAVNARDAMPVGGRLVIETKNADLYEPVAGSGSPAGPRRYVLLAVSDTLFGQSRVLKEFLARARKAAETSSTVLILGETGSGKDAVARLIQSSGPRADRPYLTVNCAALPENLLESELFGHGRGAFPGAIELKRGLFEEASGGTLFLDEVGSISVAAQAKLLRVLEEGTVRRVGENKAIPVDVRILAATNRDLRAAIAAGEFRDDLFYRLSVVTLVLPPLRERPEDIEPLARHFLAESVRRVGRERIFSPETLERLRAYSFPGNVRELRYAIEQAVILSEDRTLGPQDFLFLRPRHGSGAAAGSPASPAPREIGPERLREALEQCGGNRVRAARALGISRATLYRLLDRHRDRDASKSG